jgi:hypothetical protein
MFRQPKSPCPECQTTTILTRIAPGPPDGLDALIFECPACYHVRRQEAELIDPMKSASASGWLHGQLLAPK